MKRPLAVALWTSAALVPGGVFFAVTGMTAELVIVTAAGLAFIAMSLLPEATTTPNRRTS